MKHRRITVTPCPVDWYAMESREDGNRFCHNCSKVVVDMSGMTEEEALAFLEANPGSCGNFFADQVEAAEIPRKKTAPLSGPQSWKTAAAAAASLLLLYGSSPAIVPRPDFSEAEIERLKALPGGDGPSTNTLITGVLLDQYQSEINVPVTFSVLKGQEIIVDSATAEHGLLHLDLKGLARPSDSVTILIPDQSSHRTTISRTEMTIPLAQAQNLNVRMEVVHPMRLGGVMVRPSIED